MERNAGSRSQASELSAADLTASVDPPSLYSTSGVTGLQALGAHLPGLSLITPPQRRQRNRLEPPALGLVSDRRQFHSESSPRNEVWPS
jgi:hypothetical protein